jgi:hypothetical protein
MSKEQAREPQKKSSKNRKVRITIVIILLICVILAGLLYERTNSLSNHFKQVALYGPICGATMIISECKGLGGLIQRPLNNYDGGGKICNLPNVTGNWSAVGSSGGIKYRYRTINDTAVSGGTETTDMLSCSTAITNMSGCKCDLK